MSTDMIFQDYNALELKLRTASLHLFSFLRSDEGFALNVVDYSTLVDHMHLSKSNDFDTIVAENAIKKMFNLPDSVVSDEDKIYQDFIKFFKDSFSLIKTCVYNVIVNAKKDVYDGKVRAYDFYSMGILMYLVERIIQGDNLFINAHNIYMKHSDSLIDIIDKCYAMYESHDFKVITFDTKGDE